MSLVPDGVGLGPMVCGSARWRGVRPDGVSLGPMVKRWHRSGGGFESSQGGAEFGIPGSKRTQTLQVLLQMEQFNQKSQGRAEDNWSERLAARR